jgi:hypothetical protein
MLPGVAGRLVAEGCLSPLVESNLPQPGLVEAHRAFQRWRSSSMQLGPASSLRTMAEVGAGRLAWVIGYSPSASTGPAGRSLVLDLMTGSSTVPCVVCGWAERLESSRRIAALAARQRGTRWALLFNGTHLRLADATTLHARRWLDFDLDAVADDVLSFAALWTTARADMLAASGPADTAPLARLVADSDAFASSVCRALRDGVLSASGDVLAAILAERGAVDRRAAFEQALTLVYRILFLLFAESRGLVPIWHPVYHESYSIDALRDAAERGRSTGLWDALRAISRLAHAGCRAGDLTVTPFNGRLFDTARVPLVERRDLDDGAACRAVLALATRASPARGGRERIAYRDLGVEQLGAVYETLLDYEPRARVVPLPPGTSASRPAGLRTVVALEPGSGERKATGSFYTPQAIAQYLVRRTLAPLVHGVSPDAILALKVLDPSMGSGAFLVAACVFLADAYEEALVAAGECLPGEVGPSERAAIRRLIAERCLFGVDLNPMAVQLARLSLWLATLARNRPLSFLDHHVRAGDSLLGAWVSSLAAPPAVSKRRHDRPAPSLFDDGELEAAVRSALPIRFVLSGPNDTLEQVRAKERALAGLERHDSWLTRWKRVADLWCAHWFLGAQAPPRSAFGPLADAVLHGRGSLPPHTAGRYLDEASGVARARRFFHWELEFPEVFFDGAGQRLPAAGFDAVIGNPPWDMIRGDAGDQDRRSRDREDAGRVLRFTRDAGVYSAQSRGHANRYQLFTERSVSLLRDGGRLGLLLPGGFASDQGSGPIRRLMLSRCALDALVGFDNRRAIFPIHRSVRFLLVTGTKGSQTRRLGVRLGETDPAVLEAADCGEPGWFPLHVSPELLETLSGEGLAVPDLRSPRDLVILERAATLFPPLGSRNGWNVRFGRELNASDDRCVIVAGGAGLPVVEGKHLDPFRVRLDLTSHAVGHLDAARLLGRRHERFRLAYRDVAGAGNRLTLIAALLPAGCVSTHTVFCLRTPLPLQAQHFLCGLFNSLVVNYFVRLRVGTHVTTAVVERLPAPTRDDAPAAFRAIAALARRLSRRPGRSAGDAAASLNACVASLYQLSRAEFAHVLDTFPLIPRDARDRALARFP